MTQCDKRNNAHFGSGRTPQFHERLNAIDLINDIGLRFYYRPCSPTLITLDSKQETVPDAALVSVAKQSLIYLLDVAPTPANCISAILLKSERDATGSQKKAKL